MQTFEFELMGKLYGAPHDYIETTVSDAATIWKEHPEAETWFAFFRPTEWPGQPLGKQILTSEDLRYLANTYIMKARH